MREGTGSGGSCLLFSYQRHLSLGLAGCGQVAGGSTRGLAAELEGCCADCWTHLDSQHSRRQLGRVCALGLVCIRQSVIPVGLSVFVSIGSIDIVG